MTTAAARLPGVQERLRLLRVYETFLDYGVTSTFDHGAVGSLRRWMQTRLYDTTRPVEHLSGPVLMRLLLQDLGPTYVKLGQIVSSQSRALPGEWETELEKLQSDVRPFPPEQVREIIETELGKPVDDVYATFSPTPLAAASLAQVHLATLPDGRPVVLKVQRPGVEVGIRSDLRIMGRAASLMERRLAWARETGLHQVVDEFGSTLLRELDYRVEAYNARRLARSIGGLEGIAMPAIVRQLSTQRLLTMDYVAGVKATERDAIVAAGLDPVTIANNAVRAAIKMLLIDGFFHADPHPGNVLVNLETGTIAFIDAGMVGELSLHQRVNLINLLVTATKSDATALAQALLALSVPFREASPERFIRGFQRNVGPYLDVEEGERVPFARIMSLSVDLLREHGYRPDPQLTLATKALTQAEAFTSVLYPPGTASSFAPTAVEMVRELAADAVTRDSVEAFARKQAMSIARDALQNLPSLELGAVSWLKQIRSGQLSVKVDTSDLNEQVGTLMRMSRLLTVGVLIGCVIIASAVAANVNAGGMLRDVALVSYAVALVLAAGVVLRLLHGAFKKPGPH